MINGIINGCHIAPGERREKEEKDFFSRGAPLHGAHYLYR
jgi:hypothetical protein